LSLSPKESIDPSGSPIDAALPTRVITYAWGEHYLDILLSLTIPALLAPGNLPYVAASTSCELVILTEERFFPAVAAHPSIVHAKRLCPVRLIALDDLIAQKDKYGVALTHALHRGFSDLGPAMTETWQIFLNADFVLAEGSLRSVISRLVQGERLVASPSYCVEAAAVMPKLSEWTRMGAGTLSVPSRTLAALALANRHNTIRGKTINQPEFSLRLMDQFYWLIDEHTLLGHQMPIAIVGMRPERHLIEPITYWDHGLMREYCPEAQICVLGDSDEFLMIELREKDVAQELIETGRPPPSIVAERLITFLTPYQRDCARFELTLHSGEIPPETVTARAALGGYVGEVLSHLPTFLPSHINHPQWHYHLPGFVEFRHKFLSERLGALTEALPPPAFSSTLDRMWWILDGMEKRAARRHAELRAFVDRELRLLDEVRTKLENTLDMASAAARAELESTLGAIRGRIVPQRATITRKIDKYFNREGLALLGAGSMHLQQPSPQLQNKPSSAVQKEGQQKCFQEVEGVARELCELHQLGTHLIELELEIPRKQYRRMLPPRMASAAIPFVKVQQLLETKLKPSDTFHRISSALFQNYMLRAFGLKPMIEIVPAAGNGASRVLRVGSGSGRLISSVIDRVCGSYVWVSAAGMMTGNFSRAFETAPTFELCVCDLDFSEILEFSSIIAAIKPFIMHQGRILAYHFNQDGARLPPDFTFKDTLLPKESIRVHRSGSEVAALLIRSLRRAKNLHAAERYGELMMSLVKSAVRIGGHPIVLLARRWKLARGAVDLCRSVIVEIVVA
jgi:hypothetical protein